MRFGEQEDVVAYWACCGITHYVDTEAHKKSSVGKRPILIEARQRLEHHEADAHKKNKRNQIGSFGYIRKSAIIPEPKPDPKTWHVKPRVGKNGMILLDLSNPDEVCLIPKKWGGQYPKNSNPKRLMKLSEQQNHRCCYCGKHTWSSHYGEDGRWQDMATIEHIQCRKHGGTNKKGNIAMACSQCNNTRARMNPVVFLYERQGLIDWELVPLD
jgi:HNH endonuclease